MPKAKPTARKGRLRGTPHTRSKKASDDGKEEALVQRVTEAVLGALEGKRLEAMNEESESDSEITFKEVADDDFVTNEVIDTVTWSTPVSSMVPMKLKQKIWEDQYIDLAALLPSNLVPGPEDEDYTLKLGKDTNISVVPKKSKQFITNIFSWTTGFIRYISIYSEKFPKEIPALLKHAETVRDMASSGNSSWQTYDKQIRMDRQARGTPWGKLNVEFLIQAQKPKPESHQSFRPSKAGNKFAGKNTFAKGVCWSYNRDGVCRYDNCKFQHICAECRKNHPKTKCRVQTSSQHRGNNHNGGTSKQQ
jgi:hypothetical protein